MQRGFLYLVVIMDWAMRTAPSWRFSNTQDSVGSMGIVVKDATTLACVEHTWRGGCCGE